MIFDLTRKISGALPMVFNLKANKWLVERLHRLLYFIDTKFNTNSRKMSNAMDYLIFSDPSNNFHDVHL